MKQMFFISLIFLSISVSLFGTDSSKKDTKKGDTTSDSSDLMDNVSYVIGYNLGDRFISQGLEITLEDFFAGIKDSTGKKKGRFTNEEMNIIMNEFQTYMMAKQKEKGEKQAREGIEFLKKNKTQEGVITTESGLQYKVIKNGTGKKPGLKDTVVTHYKGTLIDGTEFDSSYKRNQPATFPVNAVIRGWTEALQLMTPGSKWILYIPSELAYGSQGSGSVIPPGSVLIFEIELIEIVDQSRENTNVK